MLKSMTGFGRAEQLVNGFNIKVQVKSVNHRYSDFLIRVPRYYNFLEDKVRQRALSYISRGKVEINIIIEQKESDDRKITLNETIAKSYIDALSELSEFGIENDIKISTLSNYNDIFNIEYKEIDEEQLFEKVSIVLNEAFDDFVRMRVDEGLRMEEDIKSHLNNILEELTFIEQRDSIRVEDYRQRLEIRIKELIESANIDESRILTETAIFADRIAINEETVRLRSHIEEFASAMRSEKPIGKKLDFIVQEMNRETNTIGSKSNDLETSKRVVEIKSEIEKIREQIQNIE